MSDLKGNINILMVTNVRWTPKLGHKILSIIFLARKGIEVLFKKAAQPSEIFVDEEVFGLANIIKNQVRFSVSRNSKTCNSQSSHSSDYRDLARSDGVFRIQVFARATKTRI